MTIRSRAVAAILTLGVGVVLSGCVADADRNGSQSAASTPTATVTHGVDVNSADGNRVTVDDLTSGAGAFFTCGGLPFPADAVLGERGLDTLNEEQRRIVDNVQGSYLETSDPAEPWFMVSQSDTMLMVLRELNDPFPAGTTIPPLPIATPTPEPPDPYALPTESHEALLLEYRDPSRSRSDHTGWQMVSLSGCALRVHTPPVGPAVVALDPDNPPDATDSAISLLVTEQGCNSGEDARGRVRIVAIEETDEAIRFVIGVKPRGGTGIQTCPSNPATPFTVWLSSPLGDRAVIDAAYLDEIQLR